MENPDKTIDKKYVDKDLYAALQYVVSDKFENHISDHYRLREISDAVCLEYGKNVLKEADFYGGEKKEYWLKQKGSMTHRELLKRDIDTAPPFPSPPILKPLNSA